MIEAGSNVRLIREQVGMSLRALADSAGIDPSTLSRIENGKQKLTGELASQIASVLHVSPSMFFAEPGVLENAMLRMRKSPLLSVEQLRTWTGPERFTEVNGQTYVFSALSVCSRQSFALAITDSANFPDVQESDVIVFDSQRQPKLGDLVVAQNAEGFTIVGAFRPSATHAEDGRFAVVPSNRLFPVVSSHAHSLLLRGTRAELRRTF